MSSYIQVLFTSYYALQKQEIIKYMKYTGCGFYVRGEILKYVNGFKFINERMLFEMKSCMVLLYRDKCTCTNKQKREEIKEEFYNLLEQNINQIANSVIKIILGDFNAKFVKENIQKPTIGNESLRNETNKNGIKMIQFAMFKVFSVRSTFPHKDIDKETWY
jgi:hypothetical protein